MLPELIGSTCHDCLQYFFSVYFAKPHTVSTTVQRTEILRLCVQKGVGVDHPFKNAGLKHRHCLTPHGDLALVQNDENPIYDMVQALI